jgi:hypothetical protein
VLTRYKLLEIERNALSAPPPLEFELSVKSFLCWAKD